LLRQDDLDTAEARFLSQHLAECDACRAHVLDYEWVGVSLRQLPQEAPPASFSAAVHARIAAIAQVEAEQRARRGAPGAAIAALSRAETLPELPVIRGVALASRPRTPSAPIVRLPVAHAQRNGFGPLARAALGMAAVFLIAVFLVQFMRGAASFGSIASGLFNGVQHSGSETRLTTYLPNTRFHTVTNALASTGWLVYSAVDATGAAMLIGENRLTKQSVFLLGAALNQPITLYALTSHWVIWAAGRVGSAGAFSTGQQWALYATLLPTATDLSALSGAELANLTYTLADDPSNGADAPDALDGVWADDSMALVAEETQAGQSALERFALNATSAPATAHRLSGVSAYHAAAGHRVMTPSADGGIIYWADVWAGADRLLHSAIWREGADGQARQAAPNDTDAFYPEAAHGALVWVSAQQPILGARALDAFTSPLATSPFTVLNAVAATATVGMSADSLATVTGAVQVYNVSNQRRSVIGEDATAQSLQVNGDLLMWRSGSRRHTYDLRAKAPTSVDSRVAAAPVAGLTGSSIAWSTGPASPIYVYDVAA